MPLTAGNDGGVDPDHLGIARFKVFTPNLDLIGLFDDMVIGKSQTAAVDDEARSQCIAFAFFLTSFCCLEAGKCPTDIFLHRSDIAISPQNRGTDFDLVDHRRPAFDRHGNLGGPLF